MKISRETLKESPIDMQEFYLKGRILFRAHKEITLTLVWWDVTESSNARTCAV